MMNKGQLNRIFQSMIERLETEPSIESLRELRFDLEESPDYRKPLIQQLYLLRYLYAYFYEYYSAFGDMFELADGDVKSGYNVLSIGCGAGFDYAALKSVIKDNELDEYVQIIRYNGIDTVCWNDSWEKEGYDLFTIDIQDFRTWLDKNADIFSKSDIILFPKSIGEFPDDYFREILQKVKREDFKICRKSVTVIGSFRRSKHDSDVERFDRFVKQIKDSGGYIKQKSRSKFCESNIGFPKINNVMNGVKPYPEKIITEILNIQKHCNRFIKRGCCCEHPNCEDSKVFKNPITTTRYFDYKVVLLQRGDL